MVPRLPSSREFRLTLLLMFGGFAAFGILPFAAWRIWQGQWLVGLIEIVLVASFLVPLWFAWRSGRTRGVSYLAVILITAGVLLLAPMIGPVALLWSFPVMIANLLLTGRQFGLAANVLLISVLVFINGMHAGTFEQVTFAITALMVSLFAYLFAILTDRQQKRLATLATYDVLTGAGNRRMMDLDLADAFARGQRAGLEHTLAIVDLDHFKAVNDNFGHEAGDRVLRDFVELAQKTLRRQDRLYRMGGEEFVVLLPDTGLTSACVALRRLQDYLRPRLASPGGAVTVSIGAALRNAGDADWKAWLGRADAALYKAKSTGRDRFVMDQVAPEPAASGPEAAPARRD